ncbi:fibrillarin-like rRNA/tRNA 2'-O-methyltransferase [Methanocaldococcus sp.]
MKEIFPNVFKFEDRLYTKALSRKKVYDEKFIEKNGVYYRSWNPYKSKLAAAIVNGLKFLPIEKDYKVLYLGASAGTTPSHVSDIVEDGIVYALEYSPRIMRELLESCSDRYNMVPILGDANKPWEYSNMVEKADLIYEDVAQPNQSEILVKNAKWFLKKDGYAIIAIKARSIDVTKDPKEVFKEQKNFLEKNGFKVLEEIDIEPYEKDHVLFVCKYLEGALND